MNILLAVDGSDHTARMLAYIVSHDEWLGRRHVYTVLTVVPYLPPRTAVLATQEWIRRYYADEADKILQPVRTLFEQQGIEARFVGEPGDVGDTIAEFADSGGFDLLVMGSHGHGSIVNLVMGSVATKVLAGCKVPVLLVR